MSAALTLANENPKTKGHEGVYDVKVVLSGNYATPGEVIDFTKLPVIKASRPPTAVEIVGGCPGGGIFEFVPGTTISTGRLKNYSAVGTELADGAYPAGVTGATIILRCYFRKNL